MYEPQEPEVVQAYYWLDSADCQCGPVPVEKTEMSLVLFWTTFHFLSYLTTNIS